MSGDCGALHHLFNSLPRHSFPFDDETIPQNGIYILFEKGEIAHGGDRIVRIGTHTGNDQLRSRLKQHFLAKNKDRSIFRKNIGRALLAKTKDNYACIWELDLTTRAAKEKYGELVNPDLQAEIENQVSDIIREKFSFSVFSVSEKQDRLRIESGLISTVSLCAMCAPSSNWLGRFSPKQKIVESGLWQVNELYKTPLVKEDFANLKTRLTEQI